MRSVAAGQPLSEKVIFIVRNSGPHARGPAVCFGCLTLGISLDFKGLEVKQDPVAGIDVDEPVTLVVGGLCAVRVLVGEVRGGDDAVLQVRNVSTAFS